MCFITRNTELILTCYLILISELFLFQLTEESEKRPNATEILEEFGVSIGRSEKKEEEGGGDEEGEDEKDEKEVDKELDEGLSLDDILRLIHLCFS